MEIGVDTLSQSELDELFSDEQSGTQQSPAADGNSSNPQQNTVTKYLNINQNNGKCLF